jgi:hypothetical protein
MKKSIKLFLVTGTILISGIQIYAQSPSVPSASQPQAPTENMISLSDQVTLKVGGFARADAFYDTHKNADALDGLLTLYPLNKSIDSTASAKDINARSLFRMSGASSRMNFKFSGPDVLNAKSSSLVEFDFTGYNGIGLRLRHAWVKLNWQNSEILFGRFWHPMFILDAIPNVLALNTGAPFNVFNRTEQIRFTYKVIPELSFMAAASAQMDYSFASNHNQVMPDLTINAQFKNDIFIVGASANYKVNQPNISITGKGKKVYQTEEQISSIAAEAYVMVKIGDLKIKGSALYGENMHELLMLGGYFVKTKDTANTNIEDYSAVKNLSCWGNITYGKKLQVNLFVGYTKNLGASDKTLFYDKKIPSVYGRGSDIDNMIRISPSIIYNVGRMQFWLELEHAIAAYGKNDYADYGKVIDSKSVSNTRVQFSSIFYF